MLPIWRRRTFIAAGLLALALSGCTATPPPTPTPTLQHRVATVSPRSASSPTAAHGPDGQRAASIASPQPDLSAPSLRLPTDGLQVVLVDSTGGEGIWIRSEPAGEPIRVWPEGAPMLVVGEDRFVDGRTWRHVQTLDGQTGWAAAEYLFQTDPSALALAAPTLADRASGPRGTEAGASPEVQARIATTGSTPSGAPATSTLAPAPRLAQAPPSAPAPPATTTPRTAARAAMKPSAANPRPPAPTKTPRPAATPRPAPTATAIPTATPIRAPHGARSMEAGPATLSLVGSERGLPIQIGNRPRAGMELLAVRVKVKNRESEPLAVYRGSFRLALSDRTLVEPLADGGTPIPYSATVEPGGELEGSLTFEVPIGTRVDYLNWAPERDVTYAIGI